MSAAGRLRRDRAFVAALAVLGALVLASWLVPWLSVHRYDRADLAADRTFMREDRFGGCEAGGSHPAHGIAKRVTAIRAGKQ